jgi:hypothetical protein
MNRICLLLCLALAVPAFGQQKFELITGKAFDGALPTNFYLEGNAIPTQKINAVMIKTPAGARALFSLIDTSGYASNIVTKYVGMIITEGDLNLCGKKIAVGSYGFGWSKPAAGADQPGKFSLYDQAGKPVADCATPRDAKIEHPKPLQVVVAPEGSARLYDGRHYIDLK